MYSTDWDYGRKYTFALMLNGDMPDWQELWFYKENNLSFSACRSKRAMGINRTGAPAARRRAVDLQGQARPTRLAACTVQAGATAFRLRLVRLLD
jgi:hypothetical protein